MGPSSKVRDEDKQWLFTLLGKPPWSWLKDQDLCLFPQTLSLSLLKHHRLVGADKANSLCVTLCAPLHAGLACFISGFSLNKDSSPKQKELYINY